MRRLRHALRWGVSVQQGRFRLGTVDIVHASRNMVAIEVDCDSKYPGELSAWGRLDGRMEVEVYADSERSLRLDESTDEVSAVTLPWPVTDKWFVLADGARYTVQIVAYRHGRRRRTAWQAPR